MQSAVRRSLVARGACSAELTAAGQRVHFYDLVGAGRGPPLVLVHGLGSSGTSFSRVMFQLARRFRRVLIPDLPGNGFSPLPASGPLPLEGQLEVLRAFVREAVDEPVMMVGNSLGGARALALALRWPEMLVALGLVAPAGAQVPRERIDALVRSLDVRDAKGARAITRRLFHRAPLVALLFASQLKRVYGSETVKSILSEVRDIEIFNPEALAGLKTSTLVLWGESEKLLPSESVAYFQRHLPQIARVQMVPGVGHIPQIERPAEVVKRLVAFADELAL